jgi:putative Mg2+ transporter-C (MgtC) family protein
MIDAAEITVRAVTATAAGALVGYEREARGQLAGIRTHALVAIGACLFTLIGAYGFPEHARGPNVDPMRVAAQVVSGIGFIGAGAIIRDRGSIRGVTTAAALWASAALGMAAGAGLFGAAAIGLVSVLFALIGLRALRGGVLERLTRRRQSISLTYSRGHGTLAPLIAAIESSGAQLESLRIDDEPDLRHVELSVRVRDGNRLRTQLGTVAELPEVHAISCP